jgi:hypothetical protein
MAFSEMKLSHPSREQTQISGLNPNVAMVMCQSFEELYETLRTGEQT